ncbi:MAG: hypothetical protein HY606_12200 [Planctomycetes bacterium]|nr:hypothetical protein [Planctomycetota bacterium]
MKRLILLAVVFVLSGSWISGSTDFISSGSVTVTLTGEISVVGVSYSNTEYLPCIYCGCCSIYKCLNEGCHLSTTSIVCGVLTAEFGSGECSSTITVTWTSCGWSMVLYSEK